MKRKSQLWQHMLTWNNWATQVGNTLGNTCYHRHSELWKIMLEPLEFMLEKVVIKNNSCLVNCVAFRKQICRIFAWVCFKTFEILIWKEKAGSMFGCNWPRCASGNGPQMVMVVTMMATMMVTMNWWWLWWWLWWWQWWQWGACLVALCQGIPLVMAPQMADAWLPKLRSVNKGRHFGANDNCDNQYLDQMCFHLNCPPRLWKWPCTVLRWYIWTCTT